jgi:Ankyrin repeats (3 copies)
MKTLALFAVSLALAQAPAATKAEQLQDAARKGDAAAVKALLDQGVDVNTKFRYDATAIFYACDAGHVDVVKVLLDKGADLNLKDTFYGFTPLMLAVSPARKKTPAHKDIVKLLIAKGAPGREMVLGAAVDDGDADMVKTILDAGPLPAASLSDALEAAKTAKKDDIIAILEKAGAKPYEDFKVDPSLLAKFPGAYKSQSGNELSIVAAGARLTLGQPAAPAAQRLTLVAIGDKAFKGIGAPISIAFQVDGDKVTGFSLTQGAGQPTIYTRVEGK